MRIIFFGTGRDKSMRLQCDALLILKGVATLQCSGLGSSSSSVHGDQRLLNGQLGV